MTKAQYEREKILALKAARDLELRKLAVARASADPRYVQDFVEWCWQRILDRKLAAKENARIAEQRRLTTLVGLYA